MKTGWPTQEEKDLIEYFDLFRRRGLVTLDSQNLDSLAELEGRGYVCEMHGTVGSITSMRKWDVSLYELSTEGIRAYRELKRDNWSYLLLQNVQERLARAC